MKTMSLTAAFAHFGVKPTNPRWSWSAVSEDGKTVVLTLWRDMFDYKQKPPAYVDPAPNYSDWCDHRGNVDRVRHLKHAAEHCDGLFRGVMTVAKDPAAHPREIADCFPWDGVWMRLTSFDEESGAWSAVVDHRD